MKLSDYDIGVIVGRFQIDELHIGHMHLIEEVLKRHKKCIIFVGVSPTLGTKKHPLDFPSRRVMIQSAFPNIVVAPMKDYKCDEVWAEKLDEKINEVYPLGKPCLYGGRDSFVDHYTPYGKYDAYEFPTHDYRPATELRAEIGKEIVDSSEFRRGIIYASQNQYPKTHFTIDVAVTKEEKGKVMVLLGRKPNEDLYRFPGGFVDQNESLEMAVRREAGEELGISLEGDINYVCSLPIEDWRYAGTGDTILTSFFQSEYTFGGAKAGDDLDYVDWFVLDNFREKDIVDSHKILIRKLKSFMNKGANNGE